MKYAFIAYSLLCIQCLIAQSKVDTGDKWNMVQAYQASTHVFYGEVSKIIPEPGFKTGIMGVRLRDIDDKLELPMEPIIWAHAKEFTFSVEAQFKETMPVNFSAYLPDPDRSIWTHVMNEAGDLFLAKPRVPEDALLKLNPGDRGLFFVRYFLGSNIPILYKVRSGLSAEEDCALLRAFRAAGNVSLESIVQQARVNQELQAQREATAVRVFEDEYYKILRIQDLEVRRNLLTDLTERLGFSGLWNYFEFKERYLKQRGANVEDSEIPQGPTEGREKLWHDISGELKKIEVILKARAT